MKCPESFFNRNSDTTNSNHSPQPLVRKLLRRRPERVLLSPELLQLCKFGRVRLGVAARLVAFLLVVSSVEAEEDVIGQWAEELDWSEHVGAVEEYDEGEVNKGVSKIATSM